MGMQIHTPQPLGSTLLFWYSCLLLSVSLYASFLHIFSSLSAFLYQFFSVTLEENSMPLSAFKGEQRLAGEGWK